MVLVDVAVLDHNHLVDVSGNNRAYVVDIGGIPSYSNPPLPPLTPSGPLAIVGGRNRKRKFVLMSSIHAEEPKKKRSCVLVKNLQSCITEEEVRLLFETANISYDGYEYMIPLQSQRANRPPQGYITVYEEQIAAGLRFPMHDMVERLCNLIQISPSQLMPNAYRMIVGFILCAKLYDISVTEGSFFSLFFVIFAKVKGLFSFSPRGKNFLVDKPSTNGPWRKKFFFLRRKGKPWNCITEWSVTFSKPPTSDAFLAGVAIRKGITDHRFLVNELTSKELLVHGGIEPGVPSSEFTFRFLMHKAAVTKFDLLPEDMPPASATIGSVCTIRQKINPPTASLSDPPTLTACAASSTQPSNKQPGNHQQSLSTTNHTDIPYPSEATIRGHLPTSSEDNIPLNEPRSKENKNHKSVFCEAHTETISTVPVSDEAEHQSIPPGLRTLWQNIVSAYVPKDRYQALETDTKELSSELEYKKSKIQELEQELELSEARGVYYKNMSSAAHEAMKIQSSLDRSRDSELADKESRIQKLQWELEVSEARRADSEKKTQFANEVIKNLQKKAEDNHKTLDSELESTKSQIGELERELRVSEKRTCLAYDDIKTLEKRAEDSRRIYESKLARAKSRIEELEGKLAVSESKRMDYEAKRVDSEKRTCLAYEDKKNMEKELAHTKSRIKELTRELEVSERKRADAEKKISLANEAIKKLEDHNSEFEKKIAKDAVEAFKSSPEFLNILQAATCYFDAFDSKSLDLPID